MANEKIQLFGMSPPVNADEIAYGGGTIADIFNGDKTFAGGIALVSEAFDFYWTSNAVPAPEDWANLTQQQVQDITKAIYDLMRRLETRVNASGYIGYAPSTHYNADGSQSLGFSSGLLFAIRANSYANAIVDNNTARFSVFFMEYGNAGYRSYGVWGKSLTLNFDSLVSTAQFNVKKRYVYETISG